MTNSHQEDRQRPVDELVQAGCSDRESFGHLFDHFHPQIFAYCSRRLIARAVAEDVTSEIFLKVAGNIRKFSGTTEEDFRRWLFRIATNEINAHLRQSIRRRELLEAAARMGTIDASISTTLTSRHEQTDWLDVYEALSGLSEQEQSIISLRFFGGLKHEQISEVLDIKTNTARVAMSRALDKLRERLRQHPAFEQKGGN